MCSTRFVRISSFETVPSRACEGMSDHASNPADLPTGTLAELFLTAVEQHGNTLAYRYFPGEGSDLKDITFDQVYSGRASRGRGPPGAGTDPGGQRWRFYRRIAWSGRLPTFACLCIGVLDVPIYSTLTAPQVAYILENSQAQMVFVSDAAQAEKVLAACRQIGRNLRVVMFDATVPSHGRAY